MIIIDETEDIICTMLENDGMYFGRQAFEIAIGKDNYGRRKFHVTVAQEELPLGYKILWSKDQGITAEGKEFLREFKQSRAKHAH